MPTRLTGVLIPVVLTILLAAVPSATAASGTACSLTTHEQRSFGPTYVTAIRVTHASCATGKAVVRAFHRCRKAQGGIRGRCTRRVRGFRCTEQRGGIPTEFSGKVTCRRDRAVVLSTYTQLT